MPIKAQHKHKNQNNLGWKGPLDHPTSAAQSRDNFQVAQSFIHLYLENLKACIYFSQEFPVPKPVPCQDCSFPCPLEWTILVLQGDSS